MELSCPFRPGKPYRVLRAFGTATQRMSAGEVLRFDSLVEFSDDGEPPKEWLMFAFSGKSQTLRLWEAQEGETLASWREYFEELSDDANAA